MRYLGSKSKIAAEILKIILPIRKPGQWWVEPFVGSAAVISLVDGPRIGADLNPYIVALHQAIALGWRPPTEVDEAQFNALKVQYKRLQKSIASRFGPKIPPGTTLEERALLGFVGSACSFGGKFFSGYAKGDGRNYAAEGANSLPDSLLLAGIDWRVCTYEDLELPANSLVYCDPPYTDTTKYEYSLRDDRAFWDWASFLVQAGHDVFISTYRENIKHRKSWREVWYKQHSTGLNQGFKSDRTEILAVKKSKEE